MSGVEGSGTVSSGGSVSGSGVSGAVAPGVEGLGSFDCVPPEGAELVGA